MKAKEEMLVNLMGANVLTDSVIVFLSLTSGGGGGAVDRHAVPLEASKFRAGHMASERRFNNRLSSRYFFFPPTRNKW